MTVEHFADGAGDAVHMLGVSRPLPAVSQTDRLYAAERQWVREGNKGNRGLSQDSAVNLIGSAVFHPSMDGVPGIEKLRDTFVPENHVKFFEDEDGKSGHTSSKGVVSLNVAPGLKLATTTHETAHLLGVHGQQFGGTARGGYEHEWPMARLHVHVVGTLFGKDSGNVLKHYYKRLGVDFGD